MPARDRSPSPRELTPNIASQARPASRASHVANAMDSMIRADRVAALEEEREAKAAAMALYRDAQRRTHAEREAMLSRERQRRNTDAARRFREQQLNTRAKVTQLTNLRVAESSAMADQAEHKKLVHLAKMQERLRIRRDFYGLRQSLTRALIEDSHTTTVDKLRTTAVSESLRRSERRHVHLDDVRQRSVLTLVAHERRLNESREAERPMTRTGSTVARVRQATPSPDRRSPAAGQRTPSPAQRAPPGPGRHGRSPPRAPSPLTIEDLRQPESAGATPTADGRPATRTGLPPLRSAAGTSSPVPTADTSAALVSRRRPVKGSRHTQLMAKEKRQFVASAIALDAAKEQRKNHEAHRVRRSPTPTAGFAPPPQAQPEANSPVHTAVPSQMRNAQNHARSWLRLFGRFQDALPGHDSPSYQQMRVTHSRPRHDGLDECCDDPVVGNESRPGTQGGRREGSTTGGGEAFFAGGDFEAVGADDDAEDIIGDDRSEISDEALRRIVDGTSSSERSGSADAPGITEEEIAASVVQRFWRTTGTALVQYRAARADAQHRAKEAELEESALLADYSARTLQSWWRASGVHVAARRRCTRARKTQERQQAMDDALRIVRQEHAAGDIQRAWRRRRV